MSCSGVTHRICPTSRSFKFSAPCGLKPNRMISALAAATKTTPMIASWSAARCRSVQMRQAAATSAAATALACTDQPLGSHPRKSETTTPRPATCAMARSMNTMPRSSTMRPSGTCVDSTRRPAKKAGQRMSKLWSATIASKADEEPLDGVVVEAEEVLRRIRAAHRERQHHRRDMRLLRNEIGRARILIGGIDDELRLALRNLIEELRQIGAARRHARLRLDRCHFVD